MSDPAKRILFDIIRTSYEAPQNLKHVIDRHMQGSRRFPSHLRRQLSQAIYGSLRWRDRLWDMCPELDDVHPETVNARIEYVRVNALQAVVPSDPSELARMLSMPRWLLDLWLEMYPVDEVLRLSMALNQEAPVCLRANLLKNTRASLQSRLSAEGVESQWGQHSETALILSKRANIRALATFREGCFDLQDEASQVASDLAGVKPGQRVLDACARSGGKTLALAAHMNNQGFLLACDTDVRTLEVLKKRVKQAGITCCQTQWVAPDDPHPLAFLKQTFDVVYVDAPCSGLGTLRRHPELKWRVQAHEIQALPQLQLRLLQRYARYLRPGGRLLYSTCTLNRHENQEVIRAFLQTNEPFQMLNERELRPDLHGTDGFYVAVLQSPKAA